MINEFKTYLAKIMLQPQETLYIDPSGCQGPESHFGAKAIKCFAHPECKYRVYTQSANIDHTMVFVFKNSQ